MAWPDRIETPGGIYHCGWRGVLRGPIYLTDGDRQRFLDDLRQTELRYRWRVLLYTLLTNHFHVLVETRKANLSAGMQRLGGVYARRFNAVHGRSGHVFERRFWSSFVKSDEEFENAIRYIRNNAVAAGLVDDADDWPWLGGPLRSRGDKGI